MLRQGYETHCNPFPPLLLTALIENLGTANRQIAPNTEFELRWEAFLSFNDGLVICLTRITLHNRAGPH